MKEVFGKDFHTQGIEPQETTPCRTIDCKAMLGQCNHIKMRTATKAEEFRLWPIRQAMAELYFTFIQVAYYNFLEFQIHDESSAPSEFVLLYVYTPREFQLKKE